MQMNLAPQCGPGRKRRCNQSGSRCQAPFFKAVDPDTIAVFAVGFPFASRLIARRRHADDRARNSELGVFFQALGNPEVGHLWHAVAVEQNVGRLHVAMHHAILVQSARDIDE